jgi:hypothetical protein
MLLLSLALPAQAVIYIGNPVLDFRVDRPAGDYVDGSVTLAKVRVHHCAGGYTDVTVNDALDPVQVYSVAIPAGDQCSLTFYWNSALDVNGPAYTVRYAQSTTAMTLSTDIAPVALTPYSVVSGSMSGGGPWLLASID